MENKFIRYSICSFTYLICILVNALWTFQLVDRYPVLTAAIEELQYYAPNANIWWIIVVGVSINYFFTIITLLSIFKILIDVFDISIDFSYVILTIVVNYFVISLISLLIGLDFTNTSLIVLKQILLPLIFMILNILVFRFIFKKKNMWICAAIASFIYACINILVILFI